MGAGFAYMTLRLGGIEFSTGVHAANNLLIVLFIQGRCRWKKPDVVRRAGHGFACARRLFLFVSYVGSDGGGGGALAAAASLVGGGSASWSGNHRCGGSTFS